MSEAPHHKKPPKPTMEETQHAGTHNLKDNGYRHMPIGLTGKRAKKEHPGLPADLHEDISDGHVPGGGVKAAQVRNRKAGDRAKRNKGRT